MLAEKRKVEKKKLDTKLQGKKKKKDARTSYKMKINPRQNFISSHKK